MNSLNKSLNILSYMYSYDGPVTPQAISKDLNIPISTVYRLLSILKMWEFVTYSQQYGSYCVGAQSLKILTQYHEQSLLVKTTEPELIHLAKGTKETAAILTHNVRETICVNMIESEQALRCSFVMGKGNTILRGASAKTLLAFRDEAYQEMVFDAHSKTLNLDAKEKLIADLQKIREQGFGYSLGEIDDGVLGVSAPIFKNNELMAVVSVMAPVFRALENKERLITLTQDAASNMTKLMNGE